MHEERIEIGGIPARIYEPAGASGLVLFGHGGGYDKDSERFVRLSRLHAEETGLAVVCIDAVGHGERRTGPAGGPPPPGWHSATTAQMVRDWQDTTAALASIGPAVAYVGFSMGMIFGAPTVAAMPSIRVAVFASGGIPTGGSIDDPPLRQLLLDAAAELTHPEVLMTSMTGDEIFRTEDTHAFFAAIPGRRKRLMFWDGDHNRWPSEAARHSIALINEHTG